MARANVYNQNKENKKSKKGLKITLISLLSLIVVAAITVGTLFGLGFFEKKTENKSYFNEVFTQNDKEYDMSKYRYNVSELKNKLIDSENAFVFVFNNDEFADNNQTENYDKTQDEEILRLVKNLVVSVTNKNNLRQISLFIVDTSIEGNEKIYANSDLGNLSDSEDPAILYFNRGNASTTVPEDLLPEAKKHGLEDTTLSAKADKKQLITTLKEVNEYIEQMYK